MPTSLVVDSCLRSNFQHPSNDLDTEIARLIELDPIYLSIYPSNLDLLLRVVRSSVRSRTLFGSFSPLRVCRRFTRERTRLLLGARIPTTTGRPRLSVAAVVGSVTTCCGTVVTACGIVRR